jgi:hypothetical protein
MSLGDELQMKWVFMHLRRKTGVGKDETYEVHNRAFKASHFYVNPFPLIIIVSAFIDNANLNHIYFVLPLPPYYLC